MSDGFLPPHGNYQELLSYRKSEVVYDITYRFAHKFLALNDRTIDRRENSHLGCFGVRASSLNLAGKAAKAGRRPAFQDRLEAYPPLFKTAS